MVCSKLATYGMKGLNQMVLLFNNIEIRMWENFDFTAFGSTQETCFEDFIKKKTTQLS